MQTIVDGNHVASRCLYSAVSNLRKSDGEATGVVYGFFKSFFYSLKKISGIRENAIVVWDGGRSKKRLELFSGYKKRERLPDEDYKEYLQQLNLIREGLNYLGANQVCVSGTEADDVISIIAHFYGFKIKINVVIVSGDKDFHQCVTDRISIFSGDSLITLQDVLNTWQVDDTTKITILRAIIGDSSDKIPGIPTLGKKRAQIVVDYLGAEVPEKYQKYFDLVRQHYDVLVRNIKLMSLPKTWEESFCTMEQLAQISTQLATNNKSVT